MLFHILEYMVYIFFRYYIYRYNVYRFWKNECRNRISYWESFSISNSYHYSSSSSFLFPFSSISSFPYFPIPIYFHFPNVFTLFCNCNSLLPLIIKCYSLFQVSDPSGENYAFIWLSDTFVWICFTFIRFFVKNICTLCLRLYLIFQNLCSSPYHTIIYFRS